MTRAKNLLIAFFFIVISGSMLVAETNSTISIFSNDGAWCWFQDPRAVYIEGMYKRTYAGWMTRQGQLQIGSFDHKSGKTEIITLKEKWGADDHNTCSFIVLPDKRLMVFYAQHNKIGLFCRTTTSPEDINSWDDEVTVTDVFEIEKCTTPDYGRAWSSEEITENSDNPNVRPVVPRYCPANMKHVLWMHGSYIHYTNYQTEIRFTVGSK